MSQSKLVIITGSIASGKSTFCKFIEDKGYKVIDADVFSRDIYDIEEIKAFTVKLYGKSILDNFSKIDRRKLTKRMLELPQQICNLNNLTHPVIMERVKEEIDKYKMEDLIFLEIPLYYESEVLISSFVSPYKLVFIKTDLEKRIERLISRSNFSKEMALAINDLFLPDDYKIKRADFVIDNSKSLQALSKSVDDLIFKLKE